MSKYWFDIKKYSGRATKIIRTLFDLLNCKENEGLMKRLGVYALPSLFYFYNERTTIA